jgi:phospholipid-binding lipoprotein MlaA
MSDPVHRTRSLAALLPVLALLAGCATTPTDPAQRAAAEANNDPWEPANRAIFDFNQAADKAVIRPVALAYRKVPDDARFAIRNFLNNMGEPLVAANKLLQGQVDGFATSVGRFVMNTTTGFLGFADTARKAGLERPIAGDFGATLAAWGAGEGPYIVIPLLGPSNVRDGIGQGVDDFADPVGYKLTTPESVSRLVLSGIDRREQADEELTNLEKSSIDFYAQLRSVTRQYRRDQLYKGGVTAKPQAERGFYEDPGAAAAAGEAAGGGTVSIPDYGTEQSPQQPSQKSSQKRAPR